MVADDLMTVMDGSLANARVCRGYAPSRLLLSRFLPDGGPDPGQSQEDKG
jgi:hypothetical protein